VLIVEDHRVVADGLALALSRDPDLHVAGVAVTAAEAVRLAVREQPDVVLLDYHLPDGTGADVARSVLRDRPDTAVVILTGDESDEILMNAIEAGVSGFLLKSQAATQVVSAVRRAAEGEMLIPPSMLAGLLGRQRTQQEERREPPSSAITLTAREQEILGMMADGLDNRAIAERLVISYTTVRSHVQNVLDKLGAHSKLEVLAIAVRRGLVDGG